MVITSSTRNRVGGNTPRGFESHLLRQNKDHPSGWSLFFTPKVGFERRLLAECRWHSATAVAFAAANGIPPPRSQRPFHTEGWRLLETCQWHVSTAVGARRPTTSKIFNGCSPQRKESHLLCRQGRRDSNSPEKFSSINKIFSPRGKFSIM